MFGFSLKGNIQHKLSSAVGSGCDQLSHVAAVDVDGLIERHVFCEEPWRKCWWAARPGMLQIIISLTGCWNHGRSRRDNLTLVQILDPQSTVHTFTSPSVLEYLEYLESWSFTLEIWFRLIFFGKTTKDNRWNYFWYLIFSSTAQILIMSFITSITFLYVEMQHLCTLVYFCTWTDFVYLTTSKYLSVLCSLFLLLSCTGVLRQVGINESECKLSDLIKHSLAHFLVREVCDCVDIHPVTCPDLPASRPTSWPVSPQRGMSAPWSPDQLGVFPLTWFSTDSPSKCFSLWVTSFTPDG